MANQKQEVELLIKAGTEGLKSIAQLVKELDSLGQDTSEASEQLEGLAGSLKGLRDQQKLVKQFSDLKRQTKSLAEEQQSAKLQATELGKALAQTEKPTRAQRNEFEKVKKASRQADQAWQDNQRELNQLRDSLNDAGVSTRDLASEQQRIKREISGVDGEIRSVSNELTGLRDNAKTAASGTGELTSGMGKFRKRLDGVGPALSKVGSGLVTVGKVVAGTTAALGASLATLTLFSRSQSEAARNITNTASALDISTQRLQEWQIAGKQFNVEGEKVSDILKDVTEKIGDFSVTGGGEGADVFEQLNLSIRDFRNLSPDQQLLKLADAITEVDSRSEQVFFLESLSSDASLLLPLLDDNAKALREIAKESQAQGAIYSEDDLAKLAKADKIYNSIDIKLKGVVNRIGAELAPVVAESTDRILKLFSSAGAADKLISVFSRLTKSTTEFFESLVKNQDSVGSGFQSLLDTVQFLGNGITSVFRGVQTVAAGVVTIVSSALTVMLTLAAKVTQGLNAIGVVGDQVYNNLQAKANAAAATTAALAKQTADYAKKAQQAGKDAAGAFDNVDKSATKTGEQVEETVGTLLPLLDEIKTSGDLAEDALSKQESAANRARQELEKMGVDAGAALQGIGKNAKSSIAQLGDIASEIERIGVSSQESADLFKNGITEALSDISTAEEFKLIDQKVRELFAEDKIDSRALDLALTQIRDRQKEIGEQDLSKGTDDLKRSADEASLSIEELAKKQQDAKEEAENARREFREAWGNAFAAALTKARESVTALSAAARNLYESRTGGNAFVKTTEDAAASLLKARQEVDELSRSQTLLRNNSFAEWFTNIALQAARVRKAFYEQKIELDGLLESVNSGSYSMQQLATLSESAASKFDLLDKQSLSGLQSAISAARSKLDSLNSSAESTLNSLRQRLADIQGDTEESQRLQYEAERKRLNEQLEQARQAGADNAAADYTKALGQLEKINSIEQQNRELSENERERDAAARQQQQQQAERDRQREQRERTAVASRQQAQPSSPSQTIVLQTPAGGQTQIQTDDPQGLLRILEEAGLRSAL